MTASSSSTVLLFVGAVVLAAIQIRAGRPVEESADHGSGIRRRSVEIVFQIAGDR